MPSPKAGIPSLADVWILCFGQCDPGELTAAFQILLKTWERDYGRKFPVPGDLTKILEAGKETLAAAKREEHWQLTLKLIAERWREDLGWMGPRLEPPLLEAASAAGGIRYLAIATGEQLVWAKKSFLEALARKEKLGDLHAAGLLAEDVDPAVKKLLSPKIQ